MRGWIFGASGLLAIATLVVACGVGTDCDFGLCAGPIVGTDGGDGPLPDANPPGCDPTRELKDQKDCLNDDFGVFVAPNGTIDGKGTMEQPVGTIARAQELIGGKRQKIFVCEGTYNERVIMKATVNIYGGLSCASTPWTVGGRAVIGKPQEPGYALDIQNLNGNFEIVDLEFVAGNGNEAFPNSIAARFVGTSGASLRRVKLTAKDGFPGKTGDKGVSGTTVKHTDFAGTPQYDPTGNPGTSTTQGSSKTCKCPNAPALEFTLGGNGGSVPSGGGLKGEPSSLPPIGVADGAGGEASAATCAVGLGHSGAARTQATGGAVATRLGGIESDGWKPESGGTGSTGLPGQGGGGGSGQSIGAGGAGSGGGCGGCGGFGGKAGTGGGASVGLLTIDSPLRVLAEIATGTGGRGGDGGDGGDGGGGGAHGNVTSGSGCLGGDGGSGGKGGAGAGGAGGLSVGILFRGSAPNSDGTTFSLKGPGDGGDGKSGNNGPKGIRSPTASVEVVSTDAGM